MGMLAQGASRRCCCRQPCLAAAGDPEPGARALAGSRAAVGPGLGRTGHSWPRRFAGLSLQQTVPLDPADCPDGPRRLTLQPHRGDGPFPGLLRRPLTVTPGLPAGGCSLTS